MDKLAVDIGFVFALRQEAVGVLDLLKHARKTRGNGWTFHTGFLENLSVALVLSGPGKKNAEAAARILIDVFEPKKICNAGYAGGLSNRLTKLTLCVPEQVVNESDGQTLDLSEAVPRQTLRMPNKLTLITADSVIETPTAKQQLNQQTGAELVDMETFAVAEVCRNRNIPFSSIRIVFDSFDDRLPADLEKIVKGLDKGISRFTGTLLGTVWKRPAVVWDLSALKSRAFTATNRLTRFLLTELKQKKENRLDRLEKDAAERRD